MKRENTSIPFLTSVAGIGSSRKAWLCDVWGVLHDGVTAFAPALQACRTFRDRGGEVVLISNSPRPSAGVVDHLDSLGVDAGCYDSIVTSGDVTRTLVEAHQGQPLFHIGPQRDKGFFEGLRVDFAPAEKATLFVCTGFYDEDRESPQDYDEMLAAFAARNVPMICANPDLVVERGNKLLPCAGLLAQRYEALGQTVIQAGKPYPPIYDAAIEKLSHPVARNEMLAIGDGADTDIKGACAQGIEAIYIVSRVHINAGSAELDRDAIQSLFASRPFRPTAAMAGLNW